MKSNRFRRFLPLFAAAGLIASGGCGSRPAASLPLIVLHPHEEEPADLRSYTGVFLAGTIDMGNSVDWQREAACSWSCARRSSVVTVDLCPDGDPRH